MAVDLGTAKGSLTLDANSFFDSLNSALKSLDNFNDEIESSKKLLIIWNPLLKEQVNL